MVECREPADAPSKKVERVTADVLSARRTAECFGGWEYLVERGRVREWVRHTHMARTAEQQAKLAEARRDRRQAHSLRDLLETKFGNGRAGSVGRMQVAISGPAGDSETGERLIELVNEFVAHAGEQRESELPGGERWPNMKEVPRTPGYRGERYSPEGEQSYYRGGREKVVVEGKQVERSRMSLEPREGTWEERVPEHLRVGDDEVEQVLAAGGAVPAGAPHAHVSDLGAADAAKPQLRADPVVRLHLGLAAFESQAADTYTASGVRVACGDRNREALEAADGQGVAG